jgi:hypothetical protein
VGESLFARKVKDFDVVVSMCVCVGVFIFLVCLCVRVRLRVHVFHQSGQLLLRLCSDGR